MSFHTKSKGDCPFVWMQKCQIWSSNAFFIFYFLHPFNFHIKIGTKSGLITPLASNASMTGGLVQEFQHTTLPSVPPAATFVMTAISIMVCWLSNISVSDY